MILIPQIVFIEIPVRISEMDASRYKTAVPSVPSDQSLSIPVIIRFCIIQYEDSVYRRDSGTKTGALGAEAF
jgi:hypothetical protein